MWPVFFVLAVVALVVFVFHLTLHMNGVESHLNRLRETLERHYGNDTGS